MTSYFHIVGPIGGRMGIALYISSPVAAGGAQATVGRLAH